MEEFSSEEAARIAPFVTNLDQPVFALRNLPEVVKGALFSRYSRSDKSLRRLLLDEFIQKPETGFHEIVRYSAESGVDETLAIRKAEEFYDRVLVGFGDDSVAELGGASLACEQVSQIAAKALEDPRIGLSPLEKSTRYVFFNQKNADGEYSYYRGSDVTQSKHATLYLQTNDLLFDTYSKLVDPLTAYFAERFPQEEGVSERAYKSTLRAKACDSLRGLLPAAALTNLGLYGNGRAFEYLMLKLHASEFAENRALASAMHVELSKIIPSFVKRSNDVLGQATQNYLRRARSNAAELAAKHLHNQPAPQKTVTLVDFDADGEDKVVAAILYSQSEHGAAEIKQLVQKLSQEEKRAIIAAYCAHRENRRHRPGRAFENAWYSFDFLANFGAYRDLQRHRILTQERQALTVRHGYDAPRALLDAGFEAEFRDAMKAAADAFETIRKDSPLGAQYVVPLAYKVRWYATLNARELYHFVELRSTRQGHADYRAVAQQMFREMQKATPLLAEAVKFVDMNNYELARLESEKFIDKRMAEVQQKYGSKSEPKK